MADRLEGRDWVAGLGDAPRVPYRLTAMRKAFESAVLRDQPMPIIYFVEGERKADKLAEWGFVSTAIAFGCKSWRAEYAKEFRDATVIILPDNDEPGHAFAHTVKEAVEAAGGKGFIVELPRLRDGGDIVDWDGTPNELHALTEKALAGGLLPIPTLDLAALAQTRAKAKAFAIERIAPLAEVTLFTGPGSAGKSLLGQQLATAAAAGLSCLGLGIQSGPAIYLTCEDDAEQLHWRQEHLCAALGVDMAGLSGRLHLASLRGEIGNELATFAADGKISPTAAFTRLSDMIKVTGAKLAFLDNVAHLFAGNENDRGDVTRFVNLLNKLAGETGAAIVLLGHPNKAGDEWSGSTAWPNAVRSRIYLEHDEETDVRTLSLPKANYGQKGEVVRFRWHEWAFLRDEDLPADTRAELTEVIKANGENAAFLACLRSRAEQGEGREVKGSTKWKKKGERTMYKQARILERFTDRKDPKGRRYGERPAAAVTVTWLDKIFAGMSETPAAANELRKVLAGTMDHAIRLNWRTDNPVRLTETYDEGEGIHTWTEAEIEQYRAKHALGTMARLTLELTINTSARRCNVAALSRDDIKSGRIAVDHAKGNEETSVEMLPTTRAALDALPVAPIKHLIINQYGRPFSVAGLGNRMRKWCDEAGLPQCSMHGLRKAMSRRIAESGGTDAEGMAVTGHKKAATFVKYRAKANRSKLADSAMSKVATSFDVQPETQNNCPT